MKTKQRGAGKPIAYEEDLAYVHDVGFDAFADESSPGLLEIMKQSGINDGHVVDLGCGSGIWARFLTDAGYDVTGVDISPAMISLSKKRAPGATFRVESFHTFRFPSCRAVTSLGEPFNYLFDKSHNRAQLTQLFRRVFATLEPGGLFIFDVAEPGRDQGRAPVFWRGEDWVCMASFETDIRRQRLTRHVTTFRRVGKLYRRSEEIHRMQLFRGSDLADVLRQIGFRVRLVRKYGKHQLAKHLVGIIARKP